MSLLTVLFWYISGKNRVFFWECWTHWKAVANALTRTDDDSHTHTYTHNTHVERGKWIRARGALLASAARPPLRVRARQAKVQLGGLATLWKSQTLFNIYIQCFDLLVTMLVFSFARIYRLTRSLLAIYTEIISASVWKHRFYKKTKHTSERNVI
jgi:hypothetical protein